MKILFVADDYPRNGSLDKSFVDGFEANGCEVKTVYPSLRTNFNDDTIKTRLINRVRTELKLYEKSIFKELTKINLEEIEFVLVFKGYNFSEATFKLLKSKPIYCYNPDDPYNPATSNKNIRDLVSKYDGYFTYSKKIVEKIAKIEKTKPYQIPFACDFELFKRTKSQKKMYPISFIGNYDLEREKYLKNLKNLKDLYVFGVNWKRKCKEKSLKGCFWGPKVANEFVQTVQSSIINLNILRQQNKTSQNMRTFEIPACGGFVLHEYSEEAAEFFAEGASIEFFRDANEMNEKIDYYLKNPHEAEVIGKNALEIVSKNNHTYKERAKEIIKLLK